MLSTPSCVMLVLRYAKARHHDIGVVGETKTVNTIGRLQLPAGDHRGFVIARHNGSIDGALHAIPFHRERNLLRYGLSDAGSLVYRGVRFTAPAVHLEWLRTESTHDE